MNYRNRELLKEQLDDIGNQFRYSDKNRAFTQLCEIVKTLVDAEKSE
jgi:hypothetical protein